MNFYIKKTTCSIFILLIQCQFLSLVAGVDSSSSSSTSASQIQIQNQSQSQSQGSNSVGKVSLVAESNVVFTPKTPQSLLKEGTKKKFKIYRKNKSSSQSSVSRAEGNSVTENYEATTANNNNAAKYSHEMAKTSRRSPLKEITDLIVYSLSNQNNRNTIGDPRTGIMLFMGITALEILTVSTLFFGLTGAVIAGLVGMVKLMAAGSIIMIG